GLELRFDGRLAGEPGAKRVQRDGAGRVIRDVEQIQAPRIGRDVVTSLDRRIQYLAHRELKQQVQRTGARSGSIVVIDPATGEVLALAHVPVFNPNDDSARDPASYRIRAITDPIEPGSVFKPLVMAAAIESGAYTPATRLHVPRDLTINGNLVTYDENPLGDTTAAEIMVRSSSVGMGIIGLNLDPAETSRMLSNLGVGRLTGTGMAGEAAVPLKIYQRDVDRATLAYGYAVQVTPLQLARAYAAIASAGMMPELTFEAVSEPARRERVLSEATAATLTAMLEDVVVSDRGTGRRAAIPYYRTAGKTGTAKLLIGGSYSDDRYRASFAGFAPASDPRLVAVVVIEDPRGREFYGGDVAAPVFSRVVGGALRILAVPPDALPVETLTRAGVDQ
ncbi:MAG: penicillin-binding protein 2, partial [Gammaproteobacteria bacterium]|nr:penicillin-binding protein 2 [Gammaproteobacteria bacterium]